MTSAFKGRVQTLTSTARRPAAELLAGFERFVTRSRALVQLARAALSLLSVIGLAFVASRVDQPVPVGLCGLLVLGPLIWIGTAIVVPVALLGRAELSAGGGVSTQSGAVITLEAGALRAGEDVFAWPTVHEVREVDGALVLLGLDEARQTAFRVELAAANFASPDARGRANPGSASDGEFANAREMSGALGRYVRAQPRPREREPRNVERTGD